MSSLDDSFDCQLPDHFQKLMLADYEEDIDLGNSFVSLFKQEKYFEILIILPKLNPFSRILPSLRLIIALTLFHLGRFDACLRELAIGIETEYNLVEKERLIHYLCRVLKSLNLDHHVSHCLGELKTISLIKNQPFSERLVSSFNINSKLIKLSIHEQTQSYIQANGDIPQYSLGRICIQVNTLVQESIKLFHKWELDVKGSIEDPLTKILEGFKMFPPNYLFDPLIKNKPVIYKFLDFKLSQFPAIDLSSNINKIIKIITSLNESLYVILTILKHQLIKGFIEYVGFHYQAAQTIFKWCLCFIDFVETQCHQFISQHKASTIRFKNLAYIYLVRTIYEGKLDYSKSSLVSIQKSLEYNTNTKSANAELCQYHLVSSIISECLSRQNSSDFEVDGQTMKLYESDEMEKMLYHLVMVITLKPSDDPSVIQIIDKILWGLLVYGGIHLKVVWFFQLLQNFYCVSFDYGMIYLQDLDKYNQIITPEYDNMEDVLTKIGNLYYEMDFVENKESFLIPNVFENTNKLVIMNQLVEEISGFHQHFQMTSETTLQRKFKSHIKLSDSFIDKRTELSNDLIETYIKCYRKYQNPDLPSIIQHFHYKL